MYSVQHSAASCTVSPPVPSWVGSAETSCRFSHSLLSSLLTCAGGHPGGRGPGAPVPGPGHHRPVRGTRHTVPVQLHPSLLLVCSTGRRRWSLPWPADSASPPTPPSQSSSGTTCPVKQSYNCICHQLHYTGVRHGEDQLHAESRAAAEEAVEWRFRLQPGQRRLVERECAQLIRIHANITILM